MKKREVDDNKSDESFQDKLINAELAGKIQAISGYDNILWKIRSGYLVILYSALTLILGTIGVPDIKGVIYNLNLSIPIFILILGFSISVGIIDLGYLTKKIKVIVARDMLIDYLTDKNQENNSNLRLMLYISGETFIDDYPEEQQVLFRDKKRWNFLRIVLPLYATTPLVVIIIGIVGTVL